MKIILIGAAGTIGSHVAAELEVRHEVIRASASRGALKVDISSLSSIRSMYKHIASFDAVVCTAGSAYFGPFEQMSEEDFYKGIRSKMMGQINLVMAGIDFVKDEGSFTLTSGILWRDPVKGGAALSTVNSAIHGFVRGASIEMKRGIRLNAVSPGLVEDSASQLGAFFPGHIPITMQHVVSGYIKSVEGAGTGQVIEVV